LDIDAGDNERNVTAERVKFIDSLTLSPELRAKKVFDAIQEYNNRAWGTVVENEKIDNWDLLCYSVSHIVTLANVYTWLQVPAKHLKNLVFNAHYLYPKGHGIIKDETNNNTSNRNS
jgi:hypothetical protein